MKPVLQAGTALHYQSAHTLARAMKSRELKAVDLVEAMLARMAAIDGTLNAFVTVCEDAAITRARTIDAALDAGLQLGPLAGVPFTVKDSVDTVGVPTQRGSRLFANRVPERDATAVARIKAAGAILLGKTNLPEFSRWWETDNVLSGRTNNPWNLDRTPGGSSGGEAAAISSGMSVLGLGTDVGISVRGPAHFTGITALKATHGAVPLTGNYPPGPNKMWHIGPMARTVKEVALAYEIIRGPDGQDGFAVWPQHSLTDRPEHPLRVGWITDKVFGPIDPEIVCAVRSAAATLQRAGCHVSEVRLPILEEIDCVAASAPFFAETLSFLKPLAEGREDELSPIAKEQLARPSSTFDEHVEAERTVERLRAAFAHYFEKYDVLLCPVVPFTAPRHGLDRYEVAGTTVETNEMMRATMPFNLTGLPALVVPFDMGASGLPIGVQLVSRWLSEHTLFSVGMLLESNAPVGGCRPPI